MTCRSEYRELDCHNLEYHTNVRRWISASVAVLGLLLLPALFTVGSLAQINGVPASVTSPGFGGRPINGTPSSVTSLGPRGFTPNAGVPFFSGSRRHDRDHEHHRRSRDSFPAFAGLFAVPVPVPYAEDAQTDAEEDDDPNYQGGPTIFDRRGPGADAYVPPVQNAMPAHRQSAASDPSPDPPQPPTTLVFKDGRQLEVGNYAIVGQTLFDLTPGHPRRIALTDLDLDATQKLNDDRGVNFQLPPTAQGS
jgi:hypothetical protein